VRGSSLTFESFFGQHYEPVRRSLAVALGDALLAEELAQDAFTRALRNWRRVGSMDRPAGWVYIVALRAARRRRRGPPATDRLRTVPDGAEAVATTTSLDIVIAGLPERQRVALVLRFHADLPLADVAAAMGCAIGTVKSTLHAALARLGETLVEEDWQ
jgi:RNA polymerase sigma factor (sigma-70 family)